MANKMTQNQFFRAQIRAQGNYVMATRLCAIEDGVERLTAYSFNNHLEALREIKDLQQKLAALGTSIALALSA